MRCLGVYRAFALLLSFAAVVAQPPAQSPYGVAVTGKLIPPKPLNWPDPDGSDCKYRGSFTTSFSVTVTVNGIGKNIKMTKSSGNKCLDKQALKAAPLQTWRPATRDGKPEEYTFTYDITFQN